VSVSETFDKRSGQEGERAVADEVHVSFSAEVYKMLEEIAERKCKSVTEVIEDALGLEQWYLRTLEEGGKIIIEGKNGEMWELVRDQR
jgi:predicted transcriptional regulator